MYILAIHCNGLILLIFNKAIKEPKIDPITPTNEIKIVFLIPLMKKLPYLEINFHHLAYLRLLLCMRSIKFFLLHYQSFDLAYLKVQESS